MSNLYYDIFETSEGWVGVLASSKGLRRTTLPELSPDLCAEQLQPDLSIAVESPKRFRDIRSKIIRFLAGNQVDFSNEHLDFGSSSPFLRAVWEACTLIPNGETRSYKWLASEASYPNASRAAGQAMARNRLPIVIPCHRVIRSDGSLGGYGSGQNRMRLKRRLLAIEAATTSEQPKVEAG